MIDTSVNQFCKVWPSAGWPIMYCVVHVYYNEIYFSRRSVKPDQKSLALGLQWLVIGLLGRIPGPMVFGGLIDDACLLWQDECGQRGSCVQYSNHHLTRLTVVSALTVKGLSATLFFLSWFCYRPNVKKAPVICSDNTNKERSLLVWEYETAL